MQKKHFIGIDVSKLTLDCHYHQGTLPVLTVDNKNSGFKVFFKWIKKEISKTADDVMIVMEYTGFYTYELELFLCNHGLGYCKKPALDIKRSSGMIRGKSDKADAKMISRYGWLRKDELKECKPTSDTQLELQQLMTFRDKLVADKASYQTRTVEMGKQLNRKLSKTVKTGSNHIVKLLETEIMEIESAIKNLLKKDEQLNQNYNLTISVTGIGFATAIHFLIATDNFTKFETYRQFACYCGVAPFEHKSGTSIRGKTKTSKLANKKLKSLLTLAAMSAIQHDEGLKQKYQQKIKEGKPKMLAINIIRAKLIERIFTVLKRQSEYIIQKAA
ncbi:MAG: IS110 family transposase [Ferruginibacter sp.]